MARNSLRGWVRDRRLRRVGALVVGHLPLGAWRKLGYRLLLGYRFATDVRIGFGTVIAVDEFVCDAGVVIARWNRFQGPIRVSMGRGTFVGRHNQVTCGEAVTNSWADGRNYGRSFTVGEDCLINEAHIFDVVGSIAVGDGTWMAGFRSQFLTHGASVRDRDIIIGPGCFFGSAVLVAPGSAVGAQTLVAMGSIVTKKFAERNVILAGTPAKVVRDRSDADEHHFERVW